MQGKCMQPAASPAVDDKLWMAGDGRGHLHCKARVLQQGQGQLCLTLVPTDWCRRPQHWRSARVLQAVQGQRGAAFAITKGFLALSGDASSVKASVSCASVWSLPSLATTYCASTTLLAMGVGGWMGVGFSGRSMQCKVFAQQGYTRRHSIRVMP